MKNKYRYLFISIFITGLIFGLIYLYNGSAWRLSLGVYFIMEVSKYLFILLGSLGFLGASALMLIRKINLKNNLPYIFIGTYNFTLGTYGVIYYVSNPESTKILHEFLFNLLLGVLILGDTFLLSGVEIHK